MILKICLKKQQYRCCKNIWFLLKGSMGNDATKVAKELL